MKQRRSFQFERQNEIYFSYRLFLRPISDLIYLFEFREDFSVIDEGGNYDHWKYSVRYTEHLSHLPMIRNVAHGHYAVKPDDHGYVISSRHRTCFFFDFFGCCKWTLHAIPFARSRSLNKKNSRFYFLA